jgi:hypothetical protein
MTVYIGLIIRQRRIKVQIIFKQIYGESPNEGIARMTTAAIQVKWMLIPAFCALTGYSAKAVRRKIEDGIWVQGKHFRKAPDGHITMDLQEYYKWVEQAA